MKNLILKNYKLPFYGFAMQYFQGDYCWGITVKNLSMVP